MGGSPEWTAAGEFGNEEERLRSGQTLCSGQNVKMIEPTCREIDASGSSLTLRVTFSTG